MTQFMPPVLSAAAVPIKQKLRDHAVLAEPQPAVLDYFKRINSQKINSLFVADPPKNVTPTYGITTCLLQPLIQAHALTKRVNNFLSGLAITLRLVPRIGRSIEALSSNLIRKE